MTPENSKVECPYLIQEKRAFKDGLNNRVYCSKPECPFGTILGQEYPAQTNEDQYRECTSRGLIDQPENYIKIIADLSRPQKSKIATGPEATRKAKILASRLESSLQASSSPSLTGKTESTAAI